MSDKVAKAVEALRKKENDKLIKWEAEMIVSLEDYTNQRIINELTDDMSIYEYVAVLIPKINYKLSEVVQRLLDSYNECSVTDVIQKFISSDAKVENVIKMKCLVNYITNIKKSSAYFEKYRKRCVSESESIKAEKKKEIEEIQKQIAELQAKLALLQM
jgi:hypothetical protein